MSAAGTHQALQDIVHLLGQKFTREAEEKVTTRGTPQSLTRTDVLAVLTARGLDRFVVQLCPGETGAEQYRAIKKTGESSTALI
eukprot:9688633-Heterocapsa_arctica.AAC.1